MKRTFSSCQKDSAWDISDMSDYNNCTHQIGASNPQILAAMGHIEKIAKNYKYLPNDIWLTLEGFDHHEEGHNSRALETAVNEIKGMEMDNLTSVMPCQENCTEKLRNIVTQLKLIEWGYYGTAEATGGLYLAYHSQKIGNYFKNSLNNYWPHYPLHDEPNDLEIRLNKCLMKITEKISNGKLKGTSVLDLPAFGSRMISLDNHQVTEANWENEINFAIYDRGNGNLSQTFRNHKNLSHLWREYIGSMNEDNPSSDSIFPPSIVKNDFDTSNEIIEHFETFFKVITGSFPTAQKGTQPIWFKTAKAVFSQTKDQDFVETYGLYDKSVMDCSFQEDLTKKKFNASEAQGGCQYFEQSLTNNGICYSFNALKPSGIWKPSKLIDLLDENTKNDTFDYRYGGTGATRGNLPNNTCNLYVWKFFNSGYKLTEKQHTQRKGLDFAFRGNLLSAFKKVGESNFLCQESNNNSLGEFVLEGGIC